MIFYGPMDSRPVANSFWLLLAGKSMSMHPMALSAHKRAKLLQDSDAKSSSLVESAVQTGCPTGHRHNLHVALAWTALLLSHGS